MKYKADVISSVLRNMEELRHQSDRILEAHRARALEKIPELAKIEAKLAQSSAQAISSAMKEGKNPAQSIEEIRKKNSVLQKERQELLVQYGFAPNYLAPIRKCAFCEDTGYQKTKLCECVKQRCAERQAQELSPLLRKSEADFSRFVFEYYATNEDKRTGHSPRENMEDNFKQCFDFAKKFGTHARNLILSGPSGLGKTYLSTCIAKVVAEQGFTVVYDTIIHVIATYEKSKFEADEQSRREIAGYEACDLLILDDLGAEMTTAFTVSALYDLINARLLSKKCVVISTNLQFADDFADRYSPAIASRLAGEYCKLPFFGKDIRTMPKQKT